MIKYPEISKISQMAQPQQKNYLNIDFGWIRNTVPPIQVNLFLFQNYSHQLTK